MHPDEVDTDAELVRRLIAEQHPRWSSLPVAPVLPRGTDNSLYRLGTEMVVRLPWREINVPPLRTELEWLPRPAPRLPLAIPEPVATGSAGSGFPFPWAVYRKMHSAATRSVFRGALDVDEATWTRARGWALSQALIALGYYTRETNAVLVKEARRWLDAVIAER